MELEAHARYVVGNGKQIWTAGIVLEDGRQYVETNPEFAQGVGRHQQPRRKLVTPELFAKLSKVWDGQ